MFIEHIKSTVQSVVTHTTQKPKKLSRRVFYYYYSGEIIDREKYGGLRPKLPPLFPATIIPSKVYMIKIDWSKGVKYGEWDAPVPE